MRRAQQLALGASRATSPNPKVGCVIVYQHRIIGEGLYWRDGSRHAEINALDAVEPQDRHLLPAATAYVSLEPCSIFGRTPPCADRLVREGLSRVVVSTIDHTPGVCGNGLAVLRRGGAEVEFGMRQEVSLEITRPRQVFAQAQRPFIMLKQASSSDGYVGRLGSRVAITARMANIISHQWRSEVDAILIGVNTLHNDAPQLSTRLVHGPSPDVIVYDPRGQLLPEQLVGLRGEVQGIDRRRHVYLATTAPAAGEEEPPASLAAPDIDVDTRVLRLSAKQPLTDLLHQLHQLRIGKLLVEGGPKTLRHFVDAGLWDEFRAWQSTVPLVQQIGKPVAALLPPGQEVARYYLGQDRLTIHRPLPHC